jgi:hypothetical protein
MPIVQKLNIWIQSIQLRSGPGNNGICGRIRIEAISNSESGRET